MYPLTRNLYVQILHVGAVNQSYFTECYAYTMFINQLAPLLTCTVTDSSIGQITIIVLNKGNMCLNGKNMQKHASLHVLHVCLHALRVPLHAVCVA